MQCRHLMNVYGKAEKDKEYGTNQSEQVFETLQIPRCIDR